MSSKFSNVLPSSKTVTSTTTYWVAIVIVSLIAIGMSVMSLDINKLLHGCVKQDSGISKLSMSAFGISIGFVIGIIVMLLMKTICMNHFPGSAIIMSVIGIIVIVIGIITNNSVKNNETGDDALKVSNVYKQSIYYISMAVGILYGALLSFVIQMRSLGPTRTTNTLIISLMLPALFVMIIGTMAITTYKKSVGDGWKTNKKCTDYQDVSDIPVGDIDLDQSDAPYNTVLWVTIGSGIIVFLSIIVPIILNKFSKK
jgi:hypothetical protein